MITYEETMIFYLQARADKLKDLKITKENQMKIEFEQKIKEEELLEAKPSK